MNYGSSDVGCWWFRSYGADQNYLITLSITTEHAPNGDAYPMARAVIDDFGTLVLVRGWV